MFSLLPENEKQRILKEYSARRTIVLLGFAAALGIIAAIALLPTYILSRAKVVETENEIQTVKESPSYKEAEKLSEELSGAKAKIAILSAEKDKLSFSSVMEKIVSYRGQPIRISAISLKRGNEKDSGEIMLRGVARDRESLSEFVTDLKSEELFNLVDLPVSNFTKDRNADFTITIRGKF